MYANHTVLKVFEVLIVFFSHVEQVKLERESLVAARTKLAQVTAELKEKEGIISAIKRERMAEQESLIDKVRLLTKLMCCLRSPIHCGSTQSHGTFCFANGR